ncbi:MAG: hypothetical protein KDD76_01835, partial [Rickettsiales bacterium]|nr:hypothetical protein [Rickettsiales bacterium]
MASMDAATRLNQLQHAFEQATGLRLAVAFELEFYLLPDISEETAHHILSQFKTLLAKDDIRLVRAEAERGEGQYEIALMPHFDAVHAATEFQCVKEHLNTAAHQYDATVCLNAQPFDDQPGSGLHVHLSLHDHDGRNLFVKQEGEETAEMLYAIAGLLDILPATMLFYAPTEASYR